MTLLYQTKITRIGELAYDALAGNLLILFNESAPKDAAEYCFIHSPGPLTGNIVPGNAVNIGQERFPVTAVGSVVAKNLSELGHITIVFDGETTARNPGSLHVAGPIPDTLSVGTTIEVHA